MLCLINFITFNEIINFQEHLLRQVDEKFDFEIHEATECDLRSHYLLLQGDKLSKLKKQRPNVNYQSNPETAVQQKDRSKVAEDVKHYDSK